MKLSSISNLLARSFIVFILAYLWLGFYIKSIPVVFLISFLIMLLVNYAVAVIGRARNTKAMLTRKQKEHMQSIILQLKFMSREKARSLFKKAFSVLEKDPVSFYPLFNTDVTTADIIRCIRYTRKDRITYIAAEKFGAEVTAFAAALEKKVVLLDAETVYSQILSPAEIFPNVTVEFKARKKLTWAEFKNLIFSRAKVRPYIIIGLVILLTSFIVRFNIYYIVLATAVFSFALISLFAVPSKRELF